MTHTPEAEAALDGTVDALAAVIDTEAENRNAANSEIDVAVRSPFHGDKFAQAWTMTDAQRRTKVLDLMQEILHEAAMELIEAQGERGSMRIDIVFAPDGDMQNRASRFVMRCSRISALITRARNLTRDYLDKPPTCRVLSVKDTNGVKGGFVSLHEEPLEVYDGLTPADLGTVRP